MCLGTDLCLFIIFLEMHGAPEEANWVEEEEAEEEAEVHVGFG